MNVDFLSEILIANDVALFGFSDFSAALPLLEVRTAAAIPTGARSVISCAFPYYIAPAVGNLSHYASVCDYHAVVLSALRKACDSLTTKFSQHVFVPFCDNAPLLEVACAVRGGLGRLGDNGLLITEDYGSYVFLGEIVTDMPLPTTTFSAQCHHCGKCAAACPTNCIVGGEKKERCLSAITQKKRITQEESDLIAAGGCAWGCDVCAKVCPMNASCRQTQIAAFRDSFHPRLTLEEVEKRLKNSAFSWRGKEPILRNLGLLNR